MIEAFEQLLARSIHRRTLLVHHVVIFKQVLAGFEVLPFHGLLRGLDAAADHARLDGHTFFHAQPLQQVRNPLLGEDAHQVVFEGEIKARGAGIALTAGTSAQLVVNTPRLVPFRAHDMQATGGNYVFVLALSSSRILRKRLIPDLLAGLEFLPLVVEAHHARAGHGIDGPLSRVHRLGRPRFSSSCLAANSALPPSTISVPRPAMLVAMVTMPSRPAWATISASRS